MLKEIHYILAEDEPPIRKNLIKKIENLAPDYKLVAEASGGTKAIEFVKENRPQVLITDIHMPGMNGLELLEILHKNYPEMILIVISGFNEFSYAQQSLRLGVEDYLLKPIDPDQLKNTLDKIRLKLQMKEDDMDSNIVHYEDRAASDLAIKTEKLINARFRENITVQILADILKINVTYLSRNYKSKYGITPSRSILIHRIELAERLLIQYPEMEIKEISSFIGYLDQNYFSRVFKKEKGMSPLLFRRNFHFE